MINIFVYHIELLSAVPESYVHQTWKFLYSPWTRENLANIHLSSMMMDETTFKSVSKRWNTLKGPIIVPDLFKISSGFPTFIAFLFPI